VYDEMLRGLAWARDPRGRPLEERAWTGHRGRFDVGRELEEAVGWAYDTLRDAGPPPPRTAREAAVLGGLARRHPRLFPDGPLVDDDGCGRPEPDVWRWIGRAVPDGLQAIGAEAGLGRGRVNRDLAEAIVGA
jgi:hypothetical protein